MELPASKLMRVGEAAKAANVVRTTLIAAISRGEIPVYPTVCKLPLVQLKDVKAWSKKTRKTGRPSRRDSRDGK